MSGVSRSPLTDVTWDGVVWYSPSIFLSPAVQRLRSRSRCRSYLILRDIFPEWAVDAGVMNRGLAYRFFKHIERSQYAVADVIGVQSPGNLPYLEQWSRRNGRRLEVLNNWLSPAPFEKPKLTGDLERRLFSGITHECIFIYAGNMGVAQGMDAMLDLAAHCGDRAHFVFVGRGSDAARLREEARTRGLSNTSFHDEVEPWEVPGVLERCDVGLVALDPRHRTHNIPGKFLTYVHAGLPVLARVNEGNDLVELINQKGVGRACGGANTELLFKFADEMISSAAARKAMGLRGRELARAMFSARAAAEQVVRGLTA